jgi:hypothetical protein
LSDFKKALHSGPNGKYDANKSSGGGTDQPSQDKKRREPKTSDDASTVKKSKSVNSSVPVVSLLSQTSSELPIKGEDVNPDDLIKSLQLLRNTASCDAAVRERISKLPPELSDLTLLQKIENKEQMTLLNHQVEDAHRMLSEYNQRLVQELEERKQVSIRLAAYHRFQKTQLQEAEKQLSDYRQRLQKVAQVKNELRSHLQNLPDLTLLPSVTGGLAPLPTPNDLFTANKIAITRKVQSEDTDSSPSSPVGPTHSPINSSPLPPAYEPSEPNFNDQTDCEIEAEYVPSAVKFNEAGGIATSYSSTFVP